MLAVVTVDAEDVGVEGAHRAVRVGDETKDDCTRREGRSHPTFVISAPILGDKSRGMSPYGT